MVLFGFWAASSLIWGRGDGDGDGDGGLLFHSVLFKIVDSLSTLANMAGLF